MHGSSSGSAVAVVPGGKLNFPKFQSLLVTSCVVGGQAKLFFLDPSTNPATLVSTLNTSVTPTAGWESLALRSDKVDLIGCGMVGGSPKIYSIDFNKITPNTTVDGTATLLYTGPAGSTCQALAWDGTSNPKTIYQSSSGAPPNCQLPPLGGRGLHRRECSFGLRRSHDRSGGRCGQRGDAGVLGFCPVRRVPGHRDDQRSVRSREPTATR